MIPSLLIGIIIWVTLTQLKSKGKVLISTEYRQYAVIAIIFLIVLPVIFGFGKVWAIKNVFQPLLSGLFLGELIGSGITNYQKKRQAKKEKQAKKKKSSSSSSSSSSRRPAPNPNETPEERAIRKEKEQKERDERHRRRAEEEVNRNIAEHLNDDE